MSRDREWVRQLAFYAFVAAVLIPLVVGLSLLAFVVTMLFLIRYWGVR